MAADEQGNDLDAVDVPITGLAAWAPREVANVIAKAELGASPLELPAAYKMLGLFKTDGGFADGREDGERIEFFQGGYSLAGDGSRNTVVGLAENNTAVLELIEGKEPDANGVIEVSASLPDNRFIFLNSTRYKSGKEERKIGVAAITAVERDQAERGSVRGANVTFTWQTDPLFNDAPYWLYYGTPGEVPAGG